MKIKTINKCSNGNINTIAKVKKIIITMFTKIDTDTIKYITIMNLIIVMMIMGIMNIMIHIMTIIVMEEILIRIMDFVLVSMEIVVILGGIQLGLALGKDKCTILIDSMILTKFYLLKPDFL